MSLESSAGLLGPSQPCWPRRRFARLEAGPPTTDDLGFVIPSDSDVTCLELLEYRVVLVVAPPWTGKSWVAKAIEGACSGEGRPFVARTSLENLGPTSSVLPGWWEKWKNSEDQALWLVDSVDEDDRARSHRVKDLLMEVERLLEVCRARLTLWFFCREYEVPDYFLARLEEVCGQVARLRLLPLDRQSAAELVRHGKFGTVCDLIRLNRLTSIAALPAVLEVLGQYEPGTSLTAAEVWSSVLKKLLTRREREAPQINDLFSMACQLAIVATFCGPAALTALSSDPEPIPSFDRLVPGDDPKVSQLTLAAQQTLKSALFAESAGQPRFAQDHTREWLAAFGMQWWQLGRVRPMVTLADGKLNDLHQGLVAILWQVTEVEAVKSWIVESSGGIVPKSDAAPWSLEQATLALDRLTELARQSAWGLTFWGERDRLEHFYVPDMAPELAKKLDAEGDPLGQRLLLRVAEVIGASEASPCALRILQDPRSQGALAQTSSALLRKAGTDSVLAELERWLATELSAGGDSVYSPQVLRGAAWVLVDRGLWNWDRAARAALIWPLKAGDYLKYYLRNDDVVPTPGAAREFVGWAAAEIEAERQTAQAPGIHFGILQALEKALGVIAVNASLADSHLLAELIRGARGKGYWVPHMVATTIRDLPELRRSIFMEILDCGGDEELLRFVYLDPDHLTWLQQVIELREDKPAHLWRRFYDLSQNAKLGGARRRDARRFMAALAPELLEELDHLRARIQHGFRAANEEKEPTYSLDELVEEALLAEDWSLENRFRRIAWLCFSRYARPSDVEGTWAELSAELRIRSVQLCHRAFHELEATSRADQSIPEGMLFEAECFQFLVENGLLELTPELIAKWLPTVLTIPDSRESGVVRNAFETHREAAEAAVLQWLELTLRLDQSDAREVPVPADLWSEELAGKVLDLADGVGVDSEVKVALHWQSVVKQRERVLLAARSWCVQSESADLSRHGVDFLMVHSPKEGLPHLLSLPAIEESLGRTRWIDSSPKLVATLDWSERSVLYDFLWRASPPKPIDSEEGTRAIGAAEWGSQVIRSAILDRFSESLEEPDARTALDDLASRIDWIRDWREQRLANLEAARLLRRQRDPATGEPWLPVDQVLAVIHSDHRRILRSVSDLHALIVEEIRAIGSDSNRHLPMLYHPPKDGERRRLHEEALQAYLECRLLDRLEPRLGQRPTVHINREPLAARNERNDLKIEAAAHNGDKLAVVIEVKWSDNDEVWTALGSQLAQRYLRDLGLTHGIYLVGDCGKWSTKDRPLGEITEGDEGVFRSQASQLDGLRIEPIVLDLQWTRP